MATVVQILNISTTSASLSQTGTTPVVLKPAFRTFQAGDTFVGDAKAVDLALLGPRHGQRELQKLLASGSIVILPSGTLT